VKKGFLSRGGHGVGTSCWCQLGDGFFFGFAQKIHRIKGGGEKGRGGRFLGGVEETKTLTLAKNQGGKEIFSRTFWWEFCWEKKKVLGDMGEEKGSFKFWGLFRVKGFFTSMAMKMGGGFRSARRKDRLGKRGSKAFFVGLR